MTKEQLAEIIGKNLAQQRKKRGLTQAELAEKLEVNAAHISRVECGKRMLSTEKVQAVAELFEISCDALYRDAEELDPSMENIMILLKNRSQAYMAWVEHVLRFSPEPPTN